MEVVLTSKSKGTPASISSILGYTFGTLFSRARFLARSIMMSHTLTTSMKGCDVRFGRYEPDTLPHPISPTRIFPPGNALAAGVDCALNKFGATPIAAPRTAVSLRNRRRSIGWSVFMAIFNLNVHLFDDGNSFILRFRCRTVFPSL